MTAPTNQEGVPKVECLGCERKVACIRVSDGTVYRPLAWTFNYPPHPTLGWCPLCLDAAKTPCAKGGKHDARRSGEGCMGCDAHDGKAKHHIAIHTAQQLVDEADLRRRIHEAIQQEAIQQGTEDPLDSATVVPAHTIEEWRHRERTEWPR